MMISTRTRSYDTTTAHATPTTAEGLAAALDARREAGGWMARCPAHEDGRPSLKVDEGADGRPLVHCFAGCEQAAVIDALRGLGLWADTPTPAGTAGRRPAPRPKPRPRPVDPAEAERRRRRIVRTYRGARPLRCRAEAMPLWLYFEARGLGGIFADIPHDLWFQPRLTYWRQESPGQYVPDGVWPAMLATVRRLDGGGANVHRTYLTTTGAKAPFEHPRKLQTPPDPGASKGAAVQLYPPGKRLAVAEGIETALAVRLATGLPVWSTISAGGMEALTLPAGLEELIIAADHDRPGLKAAEALAPRAAAEGVRARVAVPPRQGEDWADVLQRASREGMTVE